MFIEDAQRIIDEAIIGRGAKACVFFSGGVDSLVLLYLVKKHRVPVITFATDWSKSQMKQLEALICEWDLTLYVYPAKHRYVLPTPDGFSLVDEYGFAGMDLPVIRDCQESNRCLADLSKERFENFDFGFDTVFTGAIVGDSHPLTGASWFDDVEKQQGPIAFVSPLWSMRKSEIESFAKKAGIHDKVIADTGEIDVCTQCLSSDTFCPAEQKHIPRVAWDSQEALSVFRAKFGFEGVIEEL